MKIVVEFRIVAEVDMGEIHQAADIDAKLEELFDVSYMRERLVYSNTDSFITNVHNVEVAELPF